MHCVADSCKIAKRFLKSHYCGESPYGNGPKDGCAIRAPKTPPENAHVIADYRCEWNDQTGQSRCKQLGQPSSAITVALRRELLRLGMQAVQLKSVYYRVWNSSSGGWSLAEATYSETHGSDLRLCEVLVLFKTPSELHIVHEVRFQKTDADAPTVTTWSPFDIADVNGDGKDEIVLEGDAYEDHWLEVFSVGDGLETKKIYGGLGYYL
jgi:hypothetical protein